jgi:DNA-binding HxlR family transcriptional regulator
MQPTRVCSTPVPLQRSYDHKDCSVAATLELVGERWTLLIVRELLLGVHRFSELQADLGIARNVLQARLERLVENGIVERRRYQERPPRDGYHLTDKGLDLWPTIVSLMSWGDRHLPRPEGPPVRITHRACGGEIDAHRVCVRCGSQLGPRDVWAAPGDSAGPDHPLRRRAGFAPG